MKECVSKEDFNSLQKGDRILIDPSYSMSMLPIHWGVVDHFHKGGVLLYFSENSNKGNMYGVCRREIFKIEKIVKINESSI